LRCGDRVVKPLPGPKETRVGTCWRSHMSTTILNHSKNLFPPSTLPRVPGRAISHPTSPGQVMVSARSCRSDANPGWTMDESDDKAGPSRHVPVAVRRPGREALAWARLGERTFMLSGKVAGRTYTQPRSGSVLPGRGGAGSRMCAGNGQLEASRGCGPIQEGTSEGSRAAWPGSGSGFGPKKTSAGSD
jgi:hypothetical protein